MPTKKMRLEKDVFSRCNPKKKYGSAGDVVGVICYHGSVAIVENLLGERFSVRAEILTGTIIIEEAIEVPVVKIPTKQARVNKPEPINQPSLF